MKKILLFSIGILLGVSAFAQIPQRLSYQAVIRNSSQALVVNKQVTMRVYILQGSSTGTPVYIETHAPTTNLNGLISIEIGGGAVVSGNFSSIDWANGPYFVQTYTDPNGGTTYSINVTSQLLSVPYAFHARTAEKVVGGMSELDPVFGGSVAKGINSMDTARWNSKQNKIVPGSNISIANDTLKASIVETDPVFALSIAKGILASDTSNWNKKQGRLVGGTNVIISNDTISSSFTELDPVFNGSIAKGITSSDTSKWNKKQNKLILGDNIKLSGDTISAQIGNSNRFIGEYYGGGVIFHLWKDTQGIEHGLIVSTSDLNQTTWSNVTNALIGNAAQSRFDGLSNSNAIVNQVGHTNSAAKLCLDYVSNGYDDWYLPAIEQLGILWTNRFVVNNTLSSIQGSGQLFIGNLEGSPYFYYFSSTEKDNDDVWMFEFAIGKPYYAINGSKWYTQNVRAIRSF